VTFRAARRRPGGAVVGLALVAILGAAPLAALAEGFVEPARLGMPEAELRALFGDTLSEVTIRAARPAHLPIPEAAGAPDGEAGSGRQADARGAPPPSSPSTGKREASPYRDQIRLARRAGEGDVRRVEYDLHAGRVVRIRWRLAERFEQPVMDALVERLAERLGRPDYDQTIEAKLGSGKATLRRAGWTTGDRGLEVRQLHPLTGGPLFVTRSDLAALRRIVSAGGVVMPEPDTSEAWWRRPQAEPRLPTSKEIEERVTAVEALVASTEAVSGRP
jgi:hypothetical protein